MDRAVVALVVYPDGAGIRGLKSMHNVAIPLLSKPISYLQVQNIIDMYSHLIDALADPRNQVQPDVVVIGGTCSESKILGIILRD